jgi:lipid-A-disaccharide synthase
MRFALVAGEVSGDILGASLIRALRAHCPQASFYGVAGPRMVEAGCEPIESIDALSVMGLAEVLRQLPRLLRLRADLGRRFARDRPDCFIGIDAPDFNLGLEQRLRAQGVRTVHYVSPTVWAWRQGRVKGIARAADLVLCLYPFEPEFYAEHRVRAAYVGHPLADELDDSVTQSEARRALDLPPADPCIAVLPGSRHGELKYLAEPFAAAAAWLQQRRPTLNFVVPLAKPVLRVQMERAIAAHAPQARWRLLDGQSREAMRAADVVLLASGTATLECLLLGRPMVVSYRVAQLTRFILRGLGLLKISNVSLPNLLCREPVVPELLQQDARPERLGLAVLKLLQNRAATARQLGSFKEVRAELKRDAAGRAADAIDELLRS